MKITDRGVEYRVCDECGARHAHDSANILTGYYHFDPNKLADVCITCAQREMIDVCHGACLRWHYKTALNGDGLCVSCEGAQIANRYDTPLVVGADVARALTVTLRNYARVNYLISEAIVHGVTLNYVLLLEGLV